MLVLMFLPRYAGPSPAREVLTYPLTHPPPQLDVRGDAAYPSADFVHPVVELLHARRGNSRAPGARTDGHKVCV